MADIITALTTALTSVATNFYTALGDVLPIALGVVGTVMVVLLAIKVFKKITNRA